MKCSLNELCDYRKGKNAVATLNNETYISTENMLPDKAGVTMASSLPNVDYTQEYKKGDILVSNIRPYFKKIWQAKVDGGCSNDVLVFEAKSGVCKDFLYYVLADDAFFTYAMATSKGTKMPRGDKSSIMQYEVKRFSFEEQSKIASVLCCIDEKIEINKVINNNLLEQAKVLFDSWFIDFEPFDEEFVVSPIGTNIPSSLKMVQISELPHILETGKRPKGGAVSVGIPSIGAENVKKIGEVNLTSAKYIPVDFAAKMDKGKVHGYELMLYKDGGKPGIFIPHFSMFGEGFPYDEFFINEHVFKLDFGDKGYNEFAYFYFQTDYPYNWLANNGGKAAIPGINQQDVNSIWIYSPENPQVKKYCEWIQPTFTTIFKNCLQNVKLTQLRDSLLPKLMSGEINVSEIDL
ncbi:MAG: restriction endonuclease subunit S [Lachnospiraceae bacterium]|nr:restriction endonuclease subunit S [Lachnospiraceae bacterium]